MSGSEELEESTRLRTEEALREVPLSEAAIARVAPRITAMLLKRSDKPFSGYSEFWDFKGKVDTMVAHFADAGLTREAYVKAGVKNPGLFYQNPATLQGNIEGVVAHFAVDGLTLTQHLVAAVVWPQLFTQKPSTIWGNVETVVAHFAEDGLATGDYLQALLKQPSIFSQKPATIIGHINLIEAMFARGLVPPPEGSEPGVTPGVTVALRNPGLLKLADSNLALRTVYAAMAQTDNLRPLNKSRSRGWLEGEVAKVLGHEDLTQPVEKVEDTPSTRVEYARSTVLRALIRAGVIGRGSLPD